MSAANQPVEKSTVPAQKVDSSTGAGRTKAITAALGYRERLTFWALLFLFCFVTAIDYITRSVYTTYATASFEQHTLLTTIGVVTNVIGAVGQPTGAKMAEMFGRWEMLVVSLVFYVVGTIVQANAVNVQTFAGGAVLFQIGYTISFVLQVIMAADFSSLRWRLLCTMVTLSPNIITAWAAGDITEAVLGATTWRWGLGMFGILYTVFVLPVLALLLIGHRRAVASEAIIHRRSSLTASTVLNSIQKLDLIGLLLLTAAFTLFLVPFTLVYNGEGGTSQWSQAKILAPLIIGIALFPIFGWRQFQASYPVIPFVTLRDRSVWSAMAVAIIFNGAYSIIASYMYAILIVACNASIKSATRIPQIYMFALNLSGLSLGLAVAYLRRIKYAMVAGAFIALIGWGLLIKFPSRSSWGIIGGLILMGVGGGAISYPALTMAQVRTGRQPVTGLYLGASWLGSSIGGAIAGAIWTQIMPGQLHKYLDPLDLDLADRMYMDPYSTVGEYSWGSPERDAMVSAYQVVERYIAIAGISISTLLVGFAFCFHDDELVEAQPEQPSSCDHYMQAEARSEDTEPNRA